MSPERIGWPPHLAVEVGQEEVRPLIVADDPVVEASLVAGVVRSPVEHGPCLRPGGRVRDVGGIIQMRLQVA
jgi:hypothetical protein